MSDAQAARLAKLLAVELFAVICCARRAGRVSVEGERARVARIIDFTSAPNVIVIRSLRLCSSLLLTTCIASGCAMLPNVGPSTKQVEQAGAEASASGIQVVDIDDGVARRLLAQGNRKLFSETLTRQDDKEKDIGIGPGDGLEVDIWEAPPAALFGSGTLAAGGSTGAARPTTVSEQMVDRDGNISIPFAGRIAVAGQSLVNIEAEVRKRLIGKANLPQVIVRLAHNRWSTVTVVGEVNNSVKVPLSAAGERLLDALAAAGGVRQPVNKMTVQVTRGDEFYSLPMDTIIRDPRQNVRLRRGDVVTAMFQPLSFTALGATGKNDEVNFEAQGITLAQALARSGGMMDSRSDARGLFIFRFEALSALDWPHQPVMTTPEGMVPVVYRIDLRDPRSFFVMQSFQMSNKDILYVSNAPTVELQKFLNLIFSVAYPVLTTVQVTR